MASTLPRARPPHPPSANSRACWPMHRPTQTYCCEAYNILRKSANLLLSLLRLMGDASIPDISADPEKALLKLQVGSQECAPGRRAWAARRGERCRRLRKAGHPACHCCLTHPFHTLRHRPRPTGEAASGAAGRGGGAVDDTGAGRLCHRPHARCHGEGPSVGAGAAAAGAGSCGARVLWHAAAAHDAAALVTSSPLAFPCLQYWR